MLLCWHRVWPMQPDPQILSHLVGEIVEAVHPLQIILFGSGARGEMMPGSDLDFLVVMPEGTHRRRTARYLYRRVNGLRQPFDVIVATPADLERHRDTPGLVYARILQEGKQVYVG